jgi:ketosteroid isomerase-like protein
MFIPVYWNEHRICQSADLDIGGRRWLRAGDAMSSDERTTQPYAVALRLRDATNAHDVDAIVACFAEDYRNETPAHPARSFVGRDQVRRNWVQILAAIPDLTCAIVDSASTDNTVWTEWEHCGTRPDGSVHLLRGVITLTVAGDLITAARFFLEPVENDDVGVDAAVQYQLAGRDRP